MEKFVQDDQGNQYKLTGKKLGRGTYADVMLGEWINAPHNSPVKVAIKQFYLKQQTIERTLQTEIQLMKSLQHDNVVQLLSVIAPSCGDVLWVVLEYCAGGDLSSFLKDPKSPRKQRRLSEKWACKYMQQIAFGLQYLRSKNIVHRDLKPHNLLLTKDRRTVKIADFGFARVMGSEALEATLCGSPLYMAPEVIAGEQYNSKADLWSVGVILYEMLCGERPFKGRELGVLRDRVKNRPIEFPRRVQITSECRALLKGLLQKNSKQRIEWDDFFSHPWFGINWELPPKRPPGVPEQSKPVAIPERKNPLNMRIIRNYPDTLCSAPAAFAMSPPIQSPPSGHSIGSSVITRGPSSSTFIAATTPCGGSAVDIPPFDDDDDDDDSSSMSFRASSNSMRQSVSDMFSAGFGLLKDSLKSTGY